MAATEPNTADLRRLRRGVCGCGGIGWALAFLLPQSPHFSSRNFCFAKHTLIVGIRLELERYTALISGRFMGFFHDWLQRLTFGWQLAEASNARGPILLRMRSHHPGLDAAPGRRCHPAGSDAAGRFQNEAVNHMTINPHLAELERQHK